MKKIIFKSGLVILLASVFCAIVSKILFIINAAQDPRLIMLEVPKSELYDIWYKSWYIQNDLLTHFSFVLPMFAILGCSIILLAYPKDINKEIENGRGG